MAQSIDGYLWLGTDSGLYRFDGLLFERYKPLSGGPLPADGVSKLMALPNGDLWIGFRTGGISLLRSGQLTNYTTRDGLPSALVRGLAQDRNGTIWAATSSGLMRLESNRWERVGKGWNFQWQLPRAIFIDREGTLWVSTEDTLVFLNNGARRFQPTGIRVGLVAQIGQAPNGRLWIAETTRSVRPLPLSDKKLPPDDTEIRVGSEVIFFDNEGALWIGSNGDGLRRVPAPDLLSGKIAEFSTAIESFTSKDGLSANIDSAILQDREGNIWVGTHNGLDRFRETNLSPIVPPIEDPHLALAVGDAGDIWVETQGNMLRIHAGIAQRVEPFPAKYNVAQYVYRDPAGAIWWVSVDAIYRYQVGRFTRLAFPPSFPKAYLESGVAVTEDGSGTLWLGAESEGLFYLEKGVWRQPETSSEFARLATSAAFTDGMGRSWFGYDNGAIIVLKDRNIQKVFLPSDTPVGSIRAFGGRGHHTWISGELGLAFFDGNRFRRIIPTDAETFNSVIGVKETSDGSVWLAESRGVIQIPASEVQRALDDPSYRVKYRLFDASDGLPGRLTSQQSCSKELQGTDGILWFSSDSGGIVWIDPANITTNPTPPPVLIRSVKASGRKIDSLVDLVLPPRTTNLQIDYTALSLSVPERVRFRYRLDGVDKDWQDVGTRREAFYNRLDPGKYHFQVIACNNDGVWNDRGASLVFVIAPTWYQTNWFRIACLAASLAFMWGLYQLRVQHLRRQFNVRLEERVHERTRIARELHDTLLQSLHGLMFEFQAARNLFRKRPAEALQALDDAIGGTERAITESQDAIEDLGSTAEAEDDFAQSVKMVGEDLVALRQSGDDSPTFGLTVEGKQRPLNPIIQNEIYRITREVLRNAFRHAQARRIEVDILYDKDQLRLRVRDNGKGMDPEVLEKGRRPGHWGLPGARERAQQISAKLDIWSEVGAGTEVQVAVPGKEAYQTNLSRSRFRDLHRTGNDDQHS